MPDDVEFGRGWAVGLLAAFAVPPVALLAGDSVGLVGQDLSFVAVLAPLLAIAVVLGRLALHVGSSADEPALVDEGVAGATGVSSEDDPWGSDAARESDDHLESDDRESND